MRELQPPTQCRPPSLLLAGALATAIAGCASGPTNDAPRPDGAGAPEASAAAGLGETAKVDSDVRADFETAVGLLKAEKYDQGMELLIKVIQRAPGSSAPYINLAIAQQAVGKLEPAEENLKKALAISPGHPVANNEYGILYRRTGRFAEARKVYESTLDKYPSFLPARKNLAILCDLYMKDFDCALKNYQLYGEAVPNDKNVAIWISDVKTRAGR